MSRKIAFSMVVVIIVIMAIVVAMTKYATAPVSSPSPTTQK